MSHLPHIDSAPGEVLTELRASPTRRFIGVVTITALGILLLWLAATQPAAIGWRALLAAIGGAGIWCSLLLWRATSGGIVLRHEGLFTGDGAPLVLLEEIETVERGAFAFKPSNGFSVKLRSSAPFAWAPGMYWRLGRRLGVGGVTSPGEAKAIAELLQALHDQRAPG